MSTASYNNSYNMPPGTFFVFTSIFYRGERESPILHILTVFAASSVSLLPISDLICILIIRNGDVKEVIGNFKVMLRWKYRQHVKVNPPEKPVCMNVCSNLCSIPQC